MSPGSFSSQISWQHKMQTCEICLWHNASSHLFVLQGMINAVPVCPQRFVRYRPLPGDVYEQQSQQHPLIATRADLVDSKVIKQQQQTKRHHLMHSFAMCCAVILHTWTTEQLHCLTLSYGSSVVYLKDVEPCNMMVYYCAV